MTGRLISGTMSGLVFPRDHQESQRGSNVA